jgi:hypothetical protein
MCATATLKRATKTGRNLAVARGDWYSFGLAASQSQTMSARTLSRSSRARGPRTAALALCLATSFLVALPTLPTAEAANRAAVSVGDVNVSSDASAPGDAAAELSKALRLALNDELARVTGLAPMKRPLIVSATLTRLSSERRDERTKASATISLALRRADDQVLFAELRGRASVEEASGNLALLRRAALQGAVHGALARLPEVVERELAGKPGTARSR